MCETAEDGRGWLRAVRAVWHRSGWPSVRGPALKDIGEFTRSRAADKAKQNKSTADSRMSSAPQSPSLPASSSTPTASSAAQAASSYHVFQATPSNGSFSRTASVSEAPTPAPQTEVESPAANHVEEPPKPVATVDVQAISDEVWRRGKAKGRRQEEVDAMQQTAVRCVLYISAGDQQLIFLDASSIANRLSADHAAVLHPDIDRPFTSAADAVERLLPYHIYQHPLEDLFAFTHPNRKGKRKASAEDLIREEIKGASVARYVAVRAHHYSQTRDLHYNAGNARPPWRRNSGRFEYDLARSVPRKSLE